jgi:hypothetical protein
MNWHKQDVEGCKYIMDVVSSYYPDIEWEHTGGDYDRYDMDWTATTTNGNKVICKAEGKDRRKDKNGNDVNINTYSNAYLNSGKFRYMMNNVKHPYILMGYNDGVIIYNLRKLPVDDIMNDLVDAANRMMMHYDDFKDKRCIDYKWCSWNYVWNPALKRKDWELNIKLPIKDREEYKGITVLKDVKQ